MNQATAAEGSCSAGAIAIVASAGGLEALFALLACLPPNFPWPIFISQHLARNAPSVFPQVLQWKIRLPAKWATCGEIPKAGMIYVVRPGESLDVANNGFVISELPDNALSWLASVDVLFKSIAFRYGKSSIGIVLSGMMPAGVDGLRAIKARGGITIAQSQSSAAHLAMPIAAQDLGKAEIVFPPERMGSMLAMLAEERMLSRT
jgi:two-component system chemotaxis response regulator CheB